MCDTGAIAHDLVSARLADPARVSVVPLGVDARFFADENGIDETGVDLLHVGSTVTRKRIDLLLRVFSVVAAGEPTARLIRIGEPLTDAQRRLACELQIADRIVELRDVDEDTLAACYRRAVLVLQPSDREGFGLPVVEALASGTPVVASDLPVLREVGGDAVTFCPAGDVDAWARTVSGLLRERAACAAKWQARRQAGRDRARRFTWDRFADEVVRVYEQVAVASR
jgi:glycosyltransferase involved in cell wall biosynthesis